MKYAIFINLDKTLYSLNDEPKINPIDLKEIINAQNLGVDIIFCTKGKDLNRLKQTSKIINIEYAIYDNYKFIWDFKNNRNIFKEKSNDIFDQDNGKALEVFCQEREINLENVMSIGITNNDLLIFENIRFSYAMANSEKNFKKTSKYHTSSFEQGGLGEAIVDYLYRNKINKN